MPEDTKPIYAGHPANFHWVGFGSGSGTNLRECAGVKMPSAIFSDKLPYNPATGKGAKVAETDPDKLKKYDLEALVGVPRIIINGFQECGSATQQSPEEYARKSLAFNQKIVDALHRFQDQNGFGIDLIVLGGYMRLVGEPLLRAFPDKIINVHPAKLSLVTYLGETYDLADPTDYRVLFGKDLSLHGLNGLTGMKRKFVGENAVYDALKAGEKSTCSSVIMVDDGVDHGEIITTGPELEVWHEFLHGSTDEQEAMLKKYAGVHQEFQKVRSDWPALTWALRLISEGRVALGLRDTVRIGAMHFREWRHVYLDGKQQDYSGCFVNYATQKAVG